MHNEELDALAVVVAEQFFELLRLVVLTSQAEHEHTAGIGMQGDVAQNLACVLVVAAQLRASVVVVPCIYRVYPFAVGLGTEHGCQLFGNAVDTAHGWNDPYLVAGAYLAVVPHVALEREFLVFDVQFLVDGAVSILQRAGKVGLQVVLVYPVAGLQVLPCVAYRVSVLDDVCTLRRVFDKYLMARRRILVYFDLSAVNIDCCAHCHGLQAHDDSVGRINFYECFFHNVCCM